MSYIVRRQTVGKAEDLHADLLQNLANPQHYEDLDEYNTDLELFVILNNWIRQERMLAEEDPEGFNPE